MDGWANATIDEACNVEYGTRVVQKRDGGSKYPVYGGGGATFFVDASNRKNRVVVARFGMSEDCTRHVSNEFFLNDSGLTLSPKNSSALTQEFLDRLILSMNDAIYALGKGAAQKNLDVPAFRQLRIEFPRSVSEQRRIVAILDEAFDAIATVKANTEKTLLNAKDVFEHYLAHVFADETSNVQRKRLEDLCVEGRLITYGVIKLGDHVDDGVPCLRTSNVRWLHIDTFGMKRIAPPLSREYGRTILRGGEVLVNVRGTLGGVAPVPPSMAGWNVSREVAVVPIDETLLDANFAAYWIGTPESQRWLTDVKKGAAYTGINIEDLRNLPMPMPSLEKQNAIVGTIQALRDKANELERLSERKVTAINELKKSLLHQAFTGELTSKATDKQLEAVA